MNEIIKQQAVEIKRSDFKKDEIYNWMVDWLLITTNLRRIYREKRCYNAK